MTVHKINKQIHSKKKWLLFSTLFVLCLICSSNFIVAKASNRAITTDLSSLKYTNNATKFEAFVEDHADLLTEDEEQKLLEEMKPITDYGNVIFKTIVYNNRSTSAYAEEYYNTYFYSESGTIFLIDMANRQLYIYSQNAMSKIITNGVSLTITDNVYAYATREDYYTCASVAFSQIYQKLEGQSIPEPMKYTCNGLLALLLALLLNYAIIKITSRARKAKDTDLLSNLAMHCFINDPTVQFTHQTRRYSPQNSNSGSSSGGGGGGGGSSSGGGHSF